MSKAVIHIDNCSACYKSAKLVTSNHTCIHACLNVNPTRDVETVAVSKCPVTRIHDQSCSGKITILWSLSVLTLQSKNFRYLLEFQFWKLIQLHSNVYWLKYLVVTISFHVGLCGEIKSSLSTVIVYFLKMRFSRIILSLSCTANLMINMEPDDELIPKTLRFKIVYIILESDSVSPGKLYFLRFVETVV